MKRLLVRTAGLLLIEGLGVALLLGIVAWSAARNLRESSLIRRVGAQPPRLSLPSPRPAIQPEAASPADSFFRANSRPHPRGSS